MNCTLYNKKNVKENCQKPSRGLKVAFFRQQPVNKYYLDHKYQLCQRIGRQTHCFY